MATKNTNNTNDSAEARNITPNMLAESLNVSPKRLRAFIRSQAANRAGKGGAWTFTASEAAMIAERFAARTASRTTPIVWKDNEKKA